MILYLYKYQQHWCQNFCPMILFLSFLFHVISCEMIILKGGTVYAPEYLGKRDILIAGNKIISISPNFPILESLQNQFKIINCQNKIITPGIIDPHAHVTGGGGEMGPESRTPEAKLSELIMGGVTTLGLSINSSLTFQLD
jgi:dihydroorotase-like cyclic amidohydrolase